MQKEKRHTCTFCNRKRNESEMSLVRHRFYNVPTWICSEHMSAATDIFDVRTLQPRPVFLELFSGSGHIATEASIRGFDTVTVDIEPRFQPDICIDITNLRRSLLPDRVDVIWASIPCTVYSILNLSNHWHKQCIGYRRYHYSPATPEALEALRILTATLRLIRKLKPLYYFIENPRGALRHMPHVQAIPYRRHIHYSDYGFDYPKPTDIFTNCPHFTPIEATGKPALNGAAGVVALNDAYERALVPPSLINYLMESLVFLVPERH